MWLQKSSSPDFQLQCVISNCFNAVKVRCLFIFAVRGIPMIMTWYRVYTNVLNDPSRLVSIHKMHTALVAGWAGFSWFLILMILLSND